MSTLETIRTKVRRVTGRPTPQNITDAQIDEYINTFYLYDMPQQIKVFPLTTTFEFLTIPNVDQYNLLEMTVDEGNGPELVSNIYVNLAPPVYVSGYQCLWSQDREQFNNIYPNLSTQNSQLLGNGTAGPYSITLTNAPILQNSLSIGTIDSTGANIQIIDDPQNRTIGNLKIINTPTIIAGTIDYLTGNLSITFNNPIPSGTEIFISWVPYEPSRPQVVLYYSNVLTLRPVPDHQYLVKVNALKQPTSLLASTDSPILKQWWQYLAFGASKKILEDAMDTQMLSVVIPLLKEQERLVLRTQLVQQSNQRSATIYTEMNNLSSGNFQKNY